MRLEMGTFPVDDLAFGPTTRWRDGRLEVNKDEILREVLADRRIATADVDLAKPGESVRIYPVRDVVEPRFKVDGPGVAYPAIVGRDVRTVGRGRTHRLANVGVVEVSDVPWHNAGGDYVEMFIDMRGPWAELAPESTLQSVCLIVQPEPGLDIDEQNSAVHAATLTVSDALGRAVSELEPPQLEVYELRPVTSELPGVVYIQCLHAPQAKSRSTKTFCTSIYGFSGLTPPWMLHPNEVLDGAISGAYRTAFATSWTVANNPVLLELYRRHNVDIDFRGVVALKTEWTTQREKELTAAQAAKMAKMMGAQGALVTWDAGGNEFLEVIYTVRECEREGIRTVFLTSEEPAQGGAPTLLLPLPEADAIVSTGYSTTQELGVGKLPEMDRVVGIQTRKIWRTADSTVMMSEVGHPANAAIDPPWRYDDHYGFNRLSVFTY
jgi:glycine reductase